MVESNRPTTLYFARITMVSELQNGHNLDAALEKLFSKKNNYLSDSADSEFSWIFTDFEKTSNAWAGALAKMLKNEVVKVYEEGHLVDKEEQIKLKALEWSNFWFIPENHIIVFERRHEIGEIQFIEILKKGFREIFLDEKLTLEIEFLKNPKKIFDAIESADKFFRLRLHVRPTNPDTSEDLKKIDDLLKEMRTEIADLDIKSKKGTLDMKTKNTVARSGIILADKGYGTYIGEYEKNNKKYRIDSRKAIIKESLILPSDKARLIEKIIALANKALDTIKDE